MFWRIGPLLRQVQAPVLYARVAAIIPARDEADVIGRAVRSLKAQQFEGELEIFVVDDNSSDNTADIARASGARVIHSGSLPQGWTGKLWAVSQGTKAAIVNNPDYFLLTDADIEHGPNSLQNLLARNLPLASVMVKLRCESLAERLLIPPFVFFFFKLYPPSWIADPKARTAGAAGGCILIRRDMLEKTGGIQAIRNELIDDCALARAVKRHGPIWLGLSADTRSIRAYGSFETVWNMVARTAFTQLRHSSFLLAGTIVGMFLTYCVPPVFTFAGSTLAAAAWALMCVAYLPMLRFYAQPAPMALLLPAAAVFYLAATVHSAVRYWRGVGGQWKGRAQDVR
jgi:hopene-associated glycosyltransferase HpnB